MEKLQLLSKDWESRALLEEVRASHFKMKHSPVIKKKKMEWSKFVNDYQQTEEFLTAATLALGGPQRCHISVGGPHRCQISIVGPHK